MEPASLATKIVDGLACHRKQKLVGLAIMEAYRGARLQGGRNHAVVEEVAFDDMRGRRHRGGNSRRVALPEQECRIARRLRPYQRGVWLQRRGGHGDAWQRVIGDLHGFAGCHRRLRRLGDNADDGIANMPHDATGQRRTRRDDDRLDGIDNGDAWQFPDTVGREIGFGKDRHHSGDSARSFQLQPGYPGECDGRTKHVGMQHAGHVIVGDIFPAPGKEAQILQPNQGLTLISLSQTPHRLSETPRPIPIRILARAGAALQGERAAEACLFPANNV